MPLRYEDIYNERGPRFWGQHPMSIPSLLARGVSIPVWISPNAEPEQADIFDEDALSHLRSL